MKTINLPRELQNAQKLLPQLKEKPESFWIKRGERMVLNLFHDMAENVPAYGAFLRKNSVNHKKVKNILDLKKVPYVDKDNYLRSYSLEQLCWGGKLKESQWVFSTTSGSTGEPYYFPRQDLQDQQYALTAELYLLSNFHIDKQSTLYINGFAMGAWIGGLFTYQAIKKISESGKYSLSIINPGIFKEEILKALKNLGDKYDQVIIGGYPPMIKATIDEGTNKGINWEKYNLGFIFSAEAFTEKFREHIIEITGIKQPLRGTLNHYGTVDLGTMSHETPLSILLRKLSLENPELNFNLFGEEHRQPTLTQYLPELFYFEEIDNTLFCSSYSGIPLVRYNLKDHGGIHTLGKMRELLEQYGIDLSSEIIDMDIKDTMWNLPFVYVFERKDFTVKLYGANIYPDTIRKVFQEPEFAGSLTGRFSMSVSFDDKHNQYLEINIELNLGKEISKTLEERLKKAIISKLIAENSEYKSNYKEEPTKQEPKLIFWSYEHPLHFGTGGKQKWVK